MMTNEKKKLPEGEYDSPTGVAVQKLLKENPEDVVRVVLYHLVQQSHGTARKSGWHNPSPSFGEQIALVHSELSEALEDFRAGHEVSALLDGPVNSVGFAKPEGIPSELADVLIRVFDLCGVYEVDIGQATNMKMCYNATRPYRHGGKTL